MFNNLFLVLIDYTTLCNPECMALESISIPPPQRELEIPKGEGGRGQRPRKFQRGGGCMIELVSRGIPEVL